MFSLCHEVSEFSILLDEFWDFVVFQITNFWGALIVGMVGSFFGLGQLSAQVFHLVFVFYGDGVQLLIHVATP